MPKMSQEEFAAALANLSTQISTASTAAENPYFALRASFGAGIGQATPYAAGFGPVDLGGKDYIVNAAGQYLYKNGVIADPAQGAVYTPPGGIGIDPASVPGSPEWLIAIGRPNTWSEDKANRWRKRLIDLGFDGAVSGGIAESGGMAQDLLAGLAAYHQSRYLNEGRPIALRPVTAESRKQLRESVDFVALKEQAKSWGQVPFEEDLDDNTAQYFADRIVQTAMHLIKEKGWTPEEAISGAEVRVQKEFLNDPNVSSSMQEAEDDEMDETVRNDIVSIAQLASIR